MYTKPVACASPCAGDITLWMERDGYLTAVEICIDLQAALFALEKAAHAAGKHPSPEKSTLLLLGCCFYLENQEIPLSSQCRICLLGNATEWFKQMQEGWDAAAHLIHRISKKIRWRRHRPHPGRL